MEDRRALQRVVRIVEPRGVRFYGEIAGTIAYVVLLDFDYRAGASDFGAFRRGRKCRARNAGSPLRTPRETSTSYDNLPALALFFAALISLERTS